MHGPVAGQGMLEFKKSKSAPPKKFRLIQNQLFESICARNICLRSAHDYTMHTVFGVVFDSSTHIQSGSGCNREPSRREGVLVVVVMMIMMMMVVVVVVI